MNKNYTIIELSENIKPSDILQNIEQTKINNVYITRKDFAYRLTYMIEQNNDLKNKRIGINNIFNIINFFDKFTIDDKNKVFSFGKEKLIELTCVKHYQTYRQILFDAKIYKKTIDEKTGLTYAVGKHVSQAQLHNEYKYNNSPFCLILTFNDRNKKNKNILFSDKKYNSKIESALTNTTIDLQSAIIDELNYHQANNTDKRKLVYRLNNIMNIYYNNERRISTSGNCGRTTHTFSNVSKVARKHLYFKDKSYLNIDLANSQPLFLAVLMQKECWMLDYNYINNVENNQFYSQFYAIVRRITNLQNEEEIKKVVKTTLYKNIFFGFKLNKKRDILDDLIFNKFKSLYPKTFGFIADKYSSNKDYNLAVMLQQNEAELFNNINIQHSPAYFSLYDSIYFTNIKDKELIENQIKNYFSEKNIKCTTHFC